MDIKAPTFPESITDGTLAQWHKQPGEFAQRDDLLADIETDKVVIEIVAPDDGVLTEIFKAEGEIVESDELIGKFEAAADTGGEVPQADAPTQTEDVDEATSSDSGASPAARKLAAESDINIAVVLGTGRDGRVTKEDVAKVIAQGATQTVTQTGSKPIPEASVKPAQAMFGIDAMGERVERRVPMTRLRASVAKRLVEAQQNAAMLTTFNEVDMAPVMALRKKYQEDFQATHNGTRLGFMSFFVRATVEALKRFPAVNASIDGNDIIYHGYYDIGVAVSTDRGLVVPVVREADALSLAQIEDQIGHFGGKARDGKLTLEDMSGGTFTISNGGVFGSLMSTPILNAPQTGVLGMHTIQQRPVVVDGEIVIRPMMYLALSYDHRLIDGREAVRFLVAIKGMIEDPARILLEL
ncbi:MAG: 2-oxoglutarate dehydrogenase complex dihydrolipoyllysine-residue succinyltransferase [Gammaproteobacteria bacterium]|nr:2-oxoglutarate dehydrogenase complex dihydrolipoyllysine-residue succinyltransferase [Gammaproteobacteria bacterium]